MSSDENAFTKILTTAPDSANGVMGRQQSWLEKRRRSFSGDGTVACPSCRGSGIKDASTDLVALIPYTDERLRPRYTKCKITFALLICAVIIGVSTYIFLPGKVLVAATNMTIVNASIVEGGSHNTSKITWRIGIEVENGNRFLPITVSQLNITLKAWDAYDQIEVGDLTGGNITVNARGKYGRFYDILTPHDESQRDAKYNDNILTCKCCRQWTHGHCSNLHISSSVVLRYTLHVGKLQYFSNYVTHYKQHFDDCNYFDNMGIKNITCETFDQCTAGAAQTHDNIGFTEILT